MIAERRARALDLRAAGNTFESIAQTMGYTDKSRAYKDVMAALADITREPATELLTLELRRLDELQLRLIPDLDDDNMRGAAVQTILRIMDRRARYLGIDAPEKKEIKVGTVDLAAIAGARVTAEENEK